MANPDTLRLLAAPPYPNSRLPVLLYRGALRADPAAMERAFAAAGWANSWRKGIYRFHHFHSIAHEVLGIAAGRVTVRFGGPAGADAVLAAGDVAVIPAGVAHCNAGDDGDLLVVGAYPGGSRFDTLRGDPADYEDAARRAAAVPVPDRGPVAGYDSLHATLRELWGAPAA